MKKAKDFRKEAWASFKVQDSNGSRWGGVIVNFLLFGLIIGAASFTAIGALILTGPLTLGLADLFLRMRRNESWTFTTLFGGFNNFGQACLLYIVNTILISLWSMLLFVPGVIKAYSYSMSYYVLRDNPTMTQSEARRLSMQLMQGNKGRLFCLHLSFIGWMLLSALTCGILYLFVGPVMEAANAAFYEDIKSKNSKPEAAAE